MQSSRVQAAIDGVGQFIHTTEHAFLQLTELNTTRLESLVGPLKLTSRGGRSCQLKCADMLLFQTGGESNHIMATTPARKTLIVPVLVPFG